MKKAIKLFGIIAVVAVIGFSMLACKEDDNNHGKGNGNTEGNGNTGGNDLFKGTWIRQENNIDVQKIVAANNVWSSSELMNAKWIEDIRGTYLVSENDVSLIFVEVNLSAFNWNGQGSEPAAQWTSYPEVPDEIKEHLPPATMKTKIADGKFTLTFEDGSYTFIKQ